VGAATGINVEHYSEGIEELVLVEPEHASLSSYQ
jgi:hypothetical protein